MSNKEIEALNRTLALVLWAKDENGVDDVAVFAGKLVRENEIYYLEREDGSSPEIEEAWLPRIKETTSVLKETLLNCDFQLSLTVGSIDDEAVSHEHFGLKWPK